MKNESPNRAMMALFDPRHRLGLSNGYWLEKSDDNRWQVGKNRMYLGYHISSNIPVGQGGSMDREIRDFANSIHNIRNSTLEEAAQIIEQNTEIFIQSTPARMYYLIPRKPNDLSGLPYALMIRALKAKSEEIGDK